MEQESAKLMERPKLKEKAGRHDGIEEMLPLEGRQWLQELDLERCQIEVVLP